MNLRRFQRITQWWACRKTPAAAQNHAIEVKEAGEAAVERPRSRVTSGGWRAEPTSYSHRQTLLCATTAHDLTRPEMMM
jgi:hypothetical protein